MPSFEFVGKEELEEIKKVFEIDSIEDLRICEALMKTFLLVPTKKKG